MQKNKILPQRRCVGCREMKDKPHLIRIVNNTDGSVSIDPSGKAPGRGAYLCKDINCLGKAQKSKGLERSLNLENKIQEIYDSLKIIQDNNER